MKKPVIVALCCLLALSTGTAAFAEEPTPTPAPELVELSPEDPAPQFYPDSISWQEDGGQLLVVKQYSVPYGTVVADLTESGMQWGGSDYTLWGVTQSVEGGVTEEKEVTQDFELSVRSADAETARNDVKESVAYDDEYGFSGSLTLQDITIGETLQADSTYMATAHYAGTVTRTEAGTVHYTLLYAPISVPVVVAAAESGITPALLIMGIACALLFIAVLLIITHLLRKEPAHAVEPAKTAPAPKVYVPSGDIVLGGRNEDDDIHAPFYRSLCRQTYYRILHSVSSGGLSVPRRSRHSGPPSQSSFCHSRSPLSAEILPHTHTHSRDNDCCPPQIRSKVRCLFRA